ncbi:MAG: hypothetical protein QG657_2455 [Acidobacteriota bacterium]|nr:hypothetical protein [Acidobacteriota bacterium]
MGVDLRFLYLYLTDECNLNCIHCWQSAPLAGKGKYSRLALNECKYFLDSAVDLGLKNVTISGGEPLLNPEFHKFAEYFHEKQIHLALETNGILISNRDILTTIKSCGVYCAISLDGINPETHNKQRTNKCAFEKTIMGIAELEKEKINYQLIMAISKFNYHELIPLMDWIKEKFKYCETFKINNVTAMGRAERMDKKGLLLDVDEIPGITEDIAALIDRYPFKISLHITPCFLSYKNLMLKYSCGGYCGYMHALSILANGNISICSLGKQVEKYIFGHVSSIDLKNVWENNPILCDIHDNPHKKLKGICSNCVFRRRCLGGCRAQALCSYDDFFAPNPSCQAYYNSGKFPESKLINPSESASFE